MARNGSTTTPNASKRKPTRKEPKEPDGPDVPVAIQQKCLNIFRDALKPDSADDHAIVQTVKHHLYNREFEIAFGKEDFLRVYAGRWSPSRALGYVSVLEGLRPHLLVENVGEDGLGLVCFGGGAGGELVALAGWMAMLREADLLIAPVRLRAELLDIGKWEPIVATLEETIRAPPELSKYASQAKKDANQALLPPDALSVKSFQKDVLDLSPTDVAAHVDTANLTTFMFTLNELYSTSVPKTQRLLSQLTDSMAAGSHLLVVDSPGNYSTVSINGAEKKYPMQWLLDITLLGSTQAQAKEGFQATWEKVVSDQSRWFRLPQGLVYPIELENMRYQIHLYRRMSGARTEEEG